MRKLFRSGCAVKMYRLQLYRHHPIHRYWFMAWPVCYLKVRARYRGWEDPYDDAYFEAMAIQEQCD